MKKLLIHTTFIFSLLILVLQTGTSQTVANPPKLTSEVLARAFVKSLGQHKFKEATLFFDKTMSAALPEKNLKAIWQSMEKKCGDFKAIRHLEKKTVNSFDVCLVTCQFAKADLIAKVVLRDGKVSGLFFLPPISERQVKRPKPSPLPDYVSPEAYTERELPVPCGSLNLKGTLTVPKGKTRCPVVVLVHGSGPQDRDETLGPNKPFRDIALGLASRGIAVFRYDKRTKAFPKDCMQNKEFTVNEETIDDAVSAVNTLRKGSELGIDKHRIYLLGHSLGGMLIPRIAPKTPTVAGYIIMAGSSRPLEDLILEQFDYILNANGSLSEQEKLLLDRIKKQVGNVKKPTLSRQTSPQDLPFNIPPTYWLNLRGYQPAKVARKIDKPILIIQGGRDYQVTMTDFNIWRKELKGQKNVLSKTYPKLNHLFMEGSGKSTPSEYLKPGNVSKEVIDDIVKWIGQTK